MAKDRLIYQSLISQLHNTTVCTSSEVVITDIHFHLQMAQRWMSSIFTPLTRADACMRRTDGKMMSAFWPLKYQTLFVLLHRILSRMINIETRASILLIHLWYRVTAESCEPRRDQCELDWQSDRPPSLLTCHILIPPCPLPACH